MPKLVDLSGRKFGKLTVIEQHGHIGDKVAWLCRCECGNEKVVSGSNLITSQTTSCGCVWKSTMKDVHTTHGMRHTKIYKIWEAMKRRCDSPKAERYPQYGGRGIKYTPEWSKFEPFYAWALSAGYSEGLSIDRINVDGNYEPSNCQWVTMKQQGYNKTTSRFLTYQGETLTVAEWSEKTGIPYFDLYQRIAKLGWSTERALTQVAS